MLKIIDVKQGSQEWHDLRSKYYKTASRSPIVCGVSKFSTPEKLAMELRGEYTPFVTQKMQDGIDIEDELRRKISFETDTVFTPAVGVNGDFLASLDGLNANNEIIEIKDSEITYNEIKNKNLSDMYKYQMVHQMMVFDSDKNVLFAYSRENDDFQTYTIMYDTKEYREIKHNILKCWKWFDINKDDLKIEELKRSDENWKKLASKLREVDIKIKELQKEQKELKGEAIKIADGIKTTGFGLSVYQIKGRDSYDIKAIIADGINIEKYKKTSKLSWGVKIK
jgi:putative phage-type endonuclease